MVSAVNGSPYEVLKNAGFNALFYDNFTLDGEFIMRVNGEVVEHEIIHESHGDSSHFAISPTGNTIRFSNDTFNVRRDVRTTSSGYNMYWLHMNTRGFQRDTWSGMDADLHNSNYMRLMELGMDMVIGDLRHHMSMSTQSDGTRRITGAISGNQLPEIIQLLTDIAIEEEYGRSAHRFPWQNMSASDVADLPNSAVLDIPMRSLVINRLEGTAHVDSSNNLTYLSGRATVTIEDMFGRFHNVEFEMSLQFTDIGTSNPQSPIAGLEEIFTPAFVAEMFPNLARGSSLIFVTDENGNVNMESIRPSRYSSELRRW